ncbi:MAG: carboxypeptidase regulatory-like domain-containing protein [Armatimonadetes bacterium]|nr:carboxypeptidase regulatory-like domain-containing protein [Armatimonadota bacterium]
MFEQRRSWFLALGGVLCLLVVAGCGGGRSAPGSASSPDGSQPAASPGGALASVTVARSDVVSADTGGAVVTDDGSGVLVPPGALTGDTTVTVGLVSDALAPPSGRAAAGAVYAFGPQGVDFLKPVTVSVAGGAPGPRRLWNYDPAAGSWREVEESTTDVATGVVQAPVRRFFGFYAVAAAAAAESTDTTSPTVSLLAPPNGAAVSGIVAISASATDNVGVTRVVFAIDFERVAVREAAPYAFEWDTRRARPGPHRITAAAFDAAGNGATVTTVVTVSGTGGPEGRGAIAGRVVDTEGRAVAGAAVHAEGAGFARGTSDADGRFLFDGLPVGAYVVRAGKDGYRGAPVEARVEAGKTTEVTLRLEALGDSRPPVVRITAPAPGAVVAGTVAVAAAAEDNVGVVSVRFFVDGRLAAEDDSAPFGFQWDTTVVPNGEHRLSAAARDAAGNGGEAGIGVLVRNGDGGGVRPGRIEGKVRSTSGEAVASAEVVLSRLGRPVKATRTGTDGAFAFAEVPAGEGYVLVAEKAGFRRAVREGVRVEAGGTTAVELVMEPLPVVAPTPLGSIAGVVVNGEGRAPGPRR